MKTLLVASYLFISSFSFQEEPLSKIAQIKLPTNASKLAKENLKGFIQKKALTGAKAMESIKHTYIVDNILIGFEDFNTDKETSQTLDDIKDDILGEGEELLATGRKVNIINVNNKKFLISKQVFNGEYYYTFHSDFVNKKGITGSVAFKKQDQEKGEKIFEDLIKNLSFKN